MRLVLLRSAEVTLATFRDLLTNYEAAEPCPGPFEDQCAIRIGTALSGSGVSLSSFHGARCWNDNIKHILRAEELAGWLRLYPFAGRGGTQSLNPGRFQQEIDGKTGIIFFKDYWRRGAETLANRSGDHIDLWNMNRLGGAWTRYSRGLQEFFGLVSDLNASKSVLFWEVR